MTYQDTREDILPFYEDENAAIQRRDPEAARAACLGRSALMAETMIAELRRRGVFGPLRVVIADETIVPETLVAERTSLVP